MAAGALSADVMLCRVMGASMAPTIQDGDLVLLTGVESNTDIAGKIVAARIGTDATIVIHRVVRSNGSKHLLQGDAMPLPDGWIDSDSILGRVVGLKRQKSPWQESQTCRPLLKALLSLLCRMPRIPGVSWRLRSLIIQSIGKQEWSEPLDPSAFSIQRVGRELVIIEQSSGSIHNLNETARFVFERLEAGATEGEVLAAMAKQWPDAPPNILVEDLHRLLDRLRRIGLLR